MTIMNMVSLRLTPPPTPGPYLMRSRSNPNPNLNLNLSASPFSSSMTIRVRASSSSSSSSPSSEKERSLLKSVVKGSCFAIFSAALFLSGFYTPVIYPRVLSLMESERDKDKAVLNGVLDLLIDMDPEEQQEWRMLKADMVNYDDNDDDHVRMFQRMEEILKKGRLCVNGLMSGPGPIPWPWELSKLQSFSNGIQSAMHLCKKHQKDVLLKYFQLMDAQIQLKLCGDVLPPSLFTTLHQIIQQDPHDFRPYYCLGIAYIGSKDQQEVLEQLDKFTSLVPRDHPHKDKFEEYRSVVEIYLSLFE